MAEEQAKKPIEVMYETDQGDSVKLNPQIVRSYLVSGDPSKVTDQEVMMFLSLCKYGKLNPFMREAYLVKYGQEQATLITGKETFTKRASSHPNCDGWEAGVILRSQGGLEYREGAFALPDEEIVGGWANVYRKDREVPVKVSVSMQEYRRKKKDGTYMANWANMPGTMIRKVALVQALREAFPETFGGMYSPEEMPVDDSKLPTEPIKTKQVNGKEASKPKKVGKKDVENMFRMAGNDKEVVMEVINAAGYQKPSDVDANAFDGICAEIAERYNAKYRQEDEQPQQEEEKQELFDEVDDEDLQDIIDDMEDEAS